MKRFILLFISLILMLPVSVRASDAARIEGDLKVNGINFGDSSTLYSTKDLMKNKGNWSSSTLYSAGDVVQSGGSSYTCTTTNTNITPPNVAYWTLLSTQGASGLKNKGPWSFNHFV